MSAQRHEVDGKLSSGKRPKHMSVRYFFINDKVDNGDFTVEHCPSNEMLVGFITKPLQGRKFEYSRSLIMGFDIDRVDGEEVTWENFKAKGKMTRPSSPRSLLENMHVNNSLVVDPHTYRKPTYAKIAWK
uniref:Uncharacterized protein n=1 Tax=Eucampia antarctica TaxID=49252 RepID=A0A7S2WH85_9STRA|mmetsp:Transcript_30143/g.29027  ORF Transcript_30143/g.29027 Transcript_30143/m.29027 type:complete len:130 (+) Transcript_30143:965-1354(+)|eukprot:CAMPEP_0197834612 /NCGR_PEP_ID=MMETSP1437-20131217/23068_1 /TAXON_ID=49252 ORGANISM="Eucampia antarctica, Strain CCMP1452" /NCGR_SAMPLE_ID=MMETSP1437 /ASSEMBLY_ACC=CAM_ASM_001096 /LENGTH=129 /DNA_ID=CAMNT_0043439437 /DNA_START=965 /DNA_END=1354 /DNA_ORIENTATION=-